MDVRLCRKSGCRWPAAACLSFRYGTRQVWLTDLTPEPDPTQCDLCPYHAETLTVPVGWTRVDERSEDGNAAAPSGRRPADAPQPRDEGGRYAPLCADLPRVAAEELDRGRPPDGRTPAAGPSAAGAPTAGALSGQLAMAVESPGAGDAVVLPMPQRRRARPVTRGRAKD